MGDTGSKGTDPNEERDMERARGEDPQLANLTDAQNKEHQVEPVPFKITGGK